MLRESPVRLVTFGSRSIFVAIVPLLRCALAQSTANRNGFAGPVLSSGQVDAQQRLGLDGSGVRFSALRAEEYDMPNALCLASAQASRDL